MGNDQSQLKGLEIDKKTIEITDFWSLYSGEILNENEDTNCMNKIISIFQGEPVVNGQLWTNQTPLERFTKNLMIYRHPSILKYISSWEKGGIKYLATEHCKPLLSCIGQQNNVQICLGLRNILCSLIFLNEKANVRHLNICSSSIYVNVTDGGWRLAGFEHLWLAKDVNPSLFEKTHTYRYKKSMDPYDTKHNGNGLEQYAFGVLCEESLSHIKDDTIPFLMEFKKYCSTHLKHQRSEMRPKLSAILLHSYFNHEFVLIHSFLCELPLKTSQEKQQFFTTLIQRLYELNDEEIIAIQLGNLLLSRMVLLDQTAQLYCIPYLLKVKNNTNNNTNNENENNDNFNQLLFSPEIFTKYIIPKIIKIFSVRDTQIRLILLEYFSYYINYFSLAELKDEILPQLLLGIKDTNDYLVSATLHCLADLIPILGSSIVVGKNRERLFADGRPNNNSNNNNKCNNINNNNNNVNNNNNINNMSSHLYKSISMTSLTSSMISHNNLINNTNCTSNQNNQWPGEPSIVTVPRSITPILKNNSLHLDSCELIHLNNSSILDSNIDISTSVTSTFINLSNNIQQQQQMPIRLSPDGGEDVSTISDVNDLEHDGWSDWENDDNINNANNNNESSITNDEQLQQQHQITKIEEIRIEPIAADKPIYNKNTNNEFINNIIKDVADIEINVKSLDDTKNSINEFDFFKDMAPIYQKPNVMVIGDGTASTTIPSSTTVIDNDKNNLINTDENVSNKLKDKDSVIEVDKTRFEIRLEHEENIEETGWDDDVNDW